MHSAKYYYMVFLFQAPVIRLVKSVDQLVLISDELN